MGCNPRYNNLSSNEESTLFFVEIGDGSKGTPLNLNVDVICAIRRENGSGQKDKAKQKYNQWETFLFHKKLVVEIPSVRRWMKRLPPFFRQ
jgi:hypothetical protein